MQFTSRSEWGARPPKRHSGGFWGHFGATIHYTAGFAPADHDRCIATVQAIQRYHMDTRGWNDIAYNWLVCNHGIIFEGRGWSTKSGANGTAFGNRYYSAICWLGRDTEPTQAALLALAVVIHDGRSVGFGNAIHTHSWHKSTTCPGAYLTNWVTSKEADKVANEVQWLLEMVWHLRDKGSNPAAIAVMVDHLRNHPSSDGTDPLARQQAAAAHARADSAHGRLDDVREVL